MKDLNDLKKTDLLGVCLILAKSDSKRLPSKNTIDFNGKPMFMNNVLKCLKIFDKVIVSSDSVDILRTATDAGAIGRMRGVDLCGDIPNIPVYQQALKLMDYDYVVAVQANSPTIEPGLIKFAKYIMELGFNEMMTCHKDNSIYGSIWALSKDKILP
jgi:pseudaminic acid cytidylyltransferase